MMILALDASAPLGRAALVRDGEACEGVEFGGGRARASGAAGAIEALAGSGHVDAVVVGTGPGSYSGLRSSAAAAWGFAAARGVPLVGVVSLLGLADGEFLAVGDARRGQWYFAHVEGGGFRVVPCLLDVADARQRLGGLAGLPVLVPAPLGLPGELVASPDPVRLARLAALPGPLNGGLPEMVEPVYLKPPYVTLPEKKKPARPGGVLP